MSQRIYPVFATTIIAGCMIALGTFFIGVTYSADTMLSEVENLMQEMEALKRELQKVNEEKASIDREEKTLIQTGELIKEAGKNFEKDAAQWQQKWDRWKADVAEHNAQKDKSDDPAWVNAYNERAKRDNATIGASLKDEGKTLFERKKVINERREGLNQAVNDWAKKKKENNARLNELQANYEFQIKRVRSLTYLPAGRMLMQKSEAGQECADIPGIDKLEKRLEGAAEQAHRCLQKIWDGAR